MIMTFAIKLVFCVYMAINVVCMITENIWSRDSFVLHRPNEIKVKHILIFLLLMPCFLLANLSAYVLQIKKPAANQLASIAHRIGNTTVWVRKDK